MYVAIPYCTGTLVQYKVACCYVSYIIFDKWKYHTLKCVLTALEFIMIWYNNFWLINSTFYRKPIQFFKMVWSNVLSWTNIEDDPLYWSSNFSKSTNHYKNVQSRSRSSAVIQKHDVTVRREGVAVYFMHVLILIESQAVSACSHWQRAQPMLVEDDYYF